MQKLAVVVACLLFTGCAAVPTCNNPEALRHQAEAEHFFQTVLPELGALKSEQGFYYEVLQAGSDGPMPVSGDTVVVHYRLENLTGHPIDSSYERGQPVHFGLDSVIKGWSLALREMRKGEVRRLYLPANLAFGCAGQPPRIGSNEAIMADLELVDIL